MEYTVKQKIDMVVTFKGSCEYSKPSYTGYGVDYVTINKFEDESGNALIWRTSTGMIGREITDERGYGYEVPNFNAKIAIKGTVKKIGEYRGEKQIELTRVKLIDIVEQTKTREQIIEEKAAAQRATVTGGDMIWRMPYRQYKEHYADCETVVGSFRESTAWERSATIEVIIREGRLKNSGVRGEHFSGYQLTNEKGLVVVYRAVSDDNALKRAMKEFPNNTWKLTHVYEYGQYR